MVAQRAARAGDDGNRRVIQPAYIQPTVGIGTIAGSTLTIDSISALARSLAGDTVTGTDVTSGTHDHHAVNWRGDWTGRHVFALGVFHRRLTRDDRNDKLQDQPSCVTLALGSTRLRQRGSCGVSGNNTVLNQTQIQSGVNATDWYVTTPAQTIASPGIRCGPANGKPAPSTCTTTSRSAQIPWSSGRTAAAAAAVATRPATYPRRWRLGQEVTAIAFVWFSAPQGSSNEWTDRPSASVVSDVGKAAERLPTSSSDTTMRRLRCRSRQVNFQVQLTATGSSAISTVWESLANGRAGREALHRKSDGFLSVSRRAGRRSPTPA